MEIEVTPHVNVIILLASAPDSYNQPQLTDRNALSGTVWSHCSAAQLWETVVRLTLKHLKQNDTLFTVYPLHRKSLWAIMIAILCVIIHFLIVLLKSSTSLELPLRADMRVSEAINFNRRMRTPFIKPSNISARNPLRQLSNSKHFIKLCAAANLRGLRCNSAGNWLPSSTSCSHSAPHKSLCLWNCASLASPQAWDQRHRFTYCASLQLVVVTKRPV